MHKASDNELISSYLSGNEQALESLIQRYLKLIYSFVYRYTGDAASADDLTQEVFVRVWRNLKRFDQEKSFKTWLFAIAKNAALDLLKKKKAIPFSAFDDAEGNNVVVDTLADPALLPN
ncbi:MAG: sigma-70 family RNA polymerase sigma factor, partial [Candidatus Uhrbacteria bacterium]|nr:sigma-70 family RNA polymerase sigma factor [Candidatus Uhrbacteria bacterium]